MARHDARKPGWPPVYGPLHVSAQPGDGAFARSGFGQRDGLAEQLSRNRQIVLQCVFASGLLEACLDFGPVDRWTFAPAEQSQLKELADLHVVFAAKVMTDL